MKNKNKCRIPAVITQKGGVSKTTSAHCFATGLTQKGCKPLVVDTDPQGTDISYTMQVNLQSKGLYKTILNYTNSY